MLGLYRPALWQLMDLIVIELSIIDPIKVAYKYCLIGYSTATAERRVQAVARRGKIMQVVLDTIHVIPLKILQYL